MNRSVESFRSGRRPCAAVTRRPRLIVGLVVSLAVATACSPDDEIGGHDPDACPVAVVPARIGFAWEALNHRISEFTARLEPAEACEPESVFAHIVGGDFTTGEAGGISDDALLRLAVQRVRTRPEMLGVARVRIPVRIGPDGEVEGTLVVDREARGLRDYGAFEAFVGGLSFSTNVDDIEGYPDDYRAAHGYTTRGIGASARVRSITVDEVEVDWRLRLENGMAKDRANHNRAVVLAEIEAALDIIVIGTPFPTASVAEVSYTLRYDPPPALGEQEIPEADESLQRTVLPGRPGHGTGLLGIRHFDMRLDPEDRSCTRDLDCSSGTACLPEGMCDDSARPPGYYIRELTIDVIPEALDPTTGDLSVRVNGYASNATRFIEFYALTHHFEASVVRLSLPEDVPVEWIELDAQFPAGTATLPLASTGGAP